MSFRPAAETRYDMPAVFGPSLIPGETIYDSVDIITISFRTTAEAAGPLVPYHLSVREDPVVAVSRMTYHNVDFMDGRSYSEVTFGITTQFNESGKLLNGSYQPVVWLDDMPGVVAGREYLGYAKLFARVPDVVASEAEREFSVFDRDDRLLVGRVTELRPLNAAILEKVRKASENTKVFGWKYIAGPGSSVDADYVTEIPISFSPIEGWTGEGNLTWAAPDTITSAWPAT